MGAWPYTGIHATVTALLGLVFLLLTRTITWDAVLNEKEAWHTITWFAVLVMMAAQLNKLGFIGWFGDAIGESLSGFGWVTTLAILLLVYYYSHYLMASAMAHISAMYSAFLAIAIAAGAPPMLAAIVLGMFSNLYMSTTHYSSGPAPILFGAGFLSLQTGGRLALCSHLSSSQCSSSSAALGGSCSACGNAKDS